MIQHHKFITIDDLVEVAENLSFDLKTLADQKHPLMIRKGVRIIKQERESMNIKAIGRTYFLDIKETREGKPYLLITESKRKEENEERERTSIFIFQESVHEFAEAVSNLASQIPVIEKPSKHSTSSNKD